jgi:hypothetical protein
MVQSFFGYSNIRIIFCVDVAIYFLNACSWQRFAIKITILFR